MRFIDEVTIHARAGNGGNGSVSFRREKHVPMGGPDGADGGRGGDVILRADTQLGTLQDLYYAQHQAAENGHGGMGGLKSGKDGKDLILRVPRGTQVFDADTNELLADLVDAGQEFRLHGGKGGFGNVNFATPTRQAPDFAKPGRPGQERRLRLSLKVLADVGLVGFPNAGKSTLLARVSAAHPRVADYPFTTLTPNLGVVKGRRGTFVMADMPGLIEGAAEGAGLGHRFLRHLERVRLLVHLVEGGWRGERDPVKDYKAIRKELQAYGTELQALPEMVVVTKSDLPETADVVKRLQKALSKQKTKVWVICAPTGDGVQALVDEIAMRVNRLKHADRPDDEEPPQEGPYDPLARAPFEPRKRKGS